MGTVREISKELVKIIYGNPPRLLANEIFELIKRHRKDVDPIVWNDARPQRLHFSKDERVTVCWDFRVGRFDLVRILHDRYGMLDGTWKSIVFERYYDFYIRHHGRRLSGTELDQYYDLKKKYSYRISRKWKMEKYKELFGEL